MVARKLHALAVGTALFGIVPAICTAADRYLLFGGGDELSASQVSIEQNVLWFQPLLDSRQFDSGFTLFGAGPGATADVVYNAETDPEVEYWRPFTRLTAGWRTGGLLTRANLVPMLRGPSDAAMFTAQLRQLITQLEAGDRLFLLYSGHGSFEPSRTSGNALRLWGKSQLNVRELAREFQLVPAGASVQFVLPQCYSGAFLRSVFENPDRPNTASVTGQVCGFTSVSDSIESEGCTPSIDSGDYRDYASHFIGALFGQTRTGEPLRRAVASSDDGAIDFFGAHADSYIHTVSTDLPRTTSEAYLEAWQPWYLRWAATRINASNPYQSIIAAMLDRLELLRQPAADPAKYLATAADSRAAAEREAATLQEQLDDAATSEKQLRVIVADAFAVRWRGVSEVLAARNAAGTQERPDTAREWLVIQSDYQALLDFQSSINDIETRHLEARRRAAGFGRLQRAQRMAMLHEAFMSHADTNERQRYLALRACERATLPAPRVSQ